MKFNLSENGEQINIFHREIQKSSKSKKITHYIPDSLEFSFNFYDIDILAFHLQVVLAQVILHH